MFPACSKFLPLCGGSDHYLCGKEQRLHTSRVSTEQQLSKAVYLVDSVVTLLVLTVLKLLLKQELESYMFVLFILNGRTFALYATKNC